MNQHWHRPPGVIFFVFATILSIAAPARADHPQYMGTGSCSSSNCHGSVAPVTGTNVLQNEYVTWQKHDHHARAYKVLGNEDSAKIVQHLGLHDAQREPLCLKCHSTYVGEVEQRGDKYQLEDGITCESCHGAAGGWLQSHTARGASHADNVKNGMTDLRTIPQQVAMCLSCHHGNDNKTVDHRLIGAGHPRLSFELDTFESIMPRHWKIDDDYVSRKADYHSGDAWLEGQTLNAKESLEKLLSKKRSTNGIFPEFTTFNCYSCHHSLKGDQWKTRSYGNHVGEPSLNLASLVMVREALKVINPKNGAALDIKMASLHDAYKNGDAEQQLRDLEKFLGDAALTKPLTADQRSKIFKQLANYGATTKFLPYETAEQIAMALSSLSADDPSQSAAISADIEAIYASLKDEEDFAPEAFTQAVQRLSDRSAKR